LKYGDKPQPTAVDKSKLFVQSLADAEKAGADEARLERIAHDWLRACRDEAPPYRRLASIRLKRGDLDGCCDIAARGLERFPKDEELKTLLAGIDKASSGAAVLDFQTRALALREAGDFAGGLTIVEEGLATLPDSATLLKLAAKLAADLGDTERAIAYLEARASIEGEAADVWPQVARLRLAVSDGPGARAALTAAIEAGVPANALRIMRARTAFLENDFAAGLILVDEEEAEIGHTPEIFSVRKKLLTRQRIANARNGASPTRLKSAATSELRAWAERNGAPTLDADADAPRLVTPDGDIVIERAYGSRAMVIVFGGLGTMFGGGAEELDFLVQEKRVNAIFVSDPQRLFLLNGLSSIGLYPDTIAWIKDLSEAWSAPNIYCLGFSAGGYAALRYGADLSARRIFTFAAPTQITPGITQIDTRATALAHRVLTRKPDMCVNLRDYIGALGAAAPEIVNYYGELVEEDVYHARNIENLPTVQVRPIVGVDTHGVVGHLRKQGEYVKILEELFRDSED
jgi:hypothetical protein